MAGNELTAAKTFTSLALFTLLRFPLAFLPNVVVNMINARVALGRVDKFLSNSEVEHDNASFITQGMLRVAVHLMQCAAGVLIPQLYWLCFWFTLLSPFYCVLKVVLLPVP